MDRNVVISRKKSELDFHKEPRGVGAISASMSCKVLAHASRSIGRGLVALSAWCLALVQ